MNREFKRLVPFFVVIASLSCVVAAEIPTAFDLAKKGDEYLGVEAKGRIVQIQSDKSIGSLTPNIWHITYYDPNSSSKATEITFAGGEKRAVTYKGNFLHMAKKVQELPKDKLQVDSDKVLQTATTEPLLQNLTLKATRMILEDWNGIPTWKVEIWAAKLRKAEEMVSLGEVFIAAETGKVLRSDLKIKRVD